MKVNDVHLKISSGFRKFKNHLLSCKRWKRFDEFWRVLLQEVVYVDAILNTLPVVHCGRYSPSSTAKDTGQENGVNWKHVLKSELHFFEIFYIPFFIFKHFKHLKGELTDSIAFLVNFGFIWCSDYAQNNAFVVLTLT